MLNAVAMSKQTEIFNDDFIHMKERDPILKHFDNIAKTLEVIEGITYLGSEIETDENKFNYESVPKKKKRTEKEKEEDYSKNWVSTEISRLNLVTLRWKIEKEDNNFHNRNKVDEDGMRREVVELKILFPKLQDSFYFIINGMKSFPIYQIIDAGTYVTTTKTSTGRTQHALTLKSILMPITLRTKEKSYKTVMGESFESKFFILDLFSHKINVMNYFYAAKGGLEEALEYLFSRHKRLNKLETSSYIRFEYDKVNKKDLSEDDTHHYFKISNKLHLVVDKDLLKKELFLQSVTCSVIESLMNKKIRFNDEDYWMRNLGRVFSKSHNAQMDKAQRILLSLERLMDNGTKGNLRYDEEDKEDTYAIIRWMMLQDRLVEMDNMSLYNKRLRFNEYLINPLLRKFSTNTYRALNNKSITFNQITQLFNNIDPYFLVRSIRSNELLRRDTTVNTIDLFTSGLKYSFKGPQSFAQNTYSVENKYRGLHGSYVGRVGLVSSSNGDPGMTGCFTPFIQMDPESPFHFIDRETYMSQFTY